MQTRGSSHEESDLGCIRIPLASIFGYDGEGIGELLLEKIESISMGRSSGTGLWTGAHWLDRIGRQRKRELHWTVGDENERKSAWELVCGGRGCPGLLL
jgi:hypothetical protein